MNSYLYALSSETIDHFHFYIHLVFAPVIMLSTYHDFRRHHVSAQLRVLCEVAFRCGFTMSNRCRFDIKFPYYLQAVSSAGSLHIQVIVLRHDIGFSGVYYFDLNDAHSITVFWHQDANFIASITYVGA